MRKTNECAKEFLKGRTEPEPQERFELEARQFFANPVNHVGVERVAYQKAAKKVISRG